MCKRARRKEQRPGEILAAAFEAFSERGYEATRLEDVAALAGVTKGTIYVYFETKEQLFEEMVRHYSSGILADADAAIAATEGSCAEKLRALLVFLYGRCAHDRTGRETLRFIVAEGKNFPGLVEAHRREFVLPAVQLVEKLLETGMSNGEFSVGIRKETACIVIAPVVALAVSTLIFAGGTQVHESSYQSTHLDLILNGLRSRTPGAPREPE